MSKRRLRNNKRKRVEPIKVILGKIPGTTTKKAITETKERIHKFPTTTRIQKKEFLLKNIRNTMTEGVRITRRITVPGIPVSIPSERIKAGRTAMTIRIDNPKL